MSTSFGKRVLQARLSLSARQGRQVTQGEIAAKMGVTGVTVSRWEADLKEPTLETIRKLAKVLSVEASYLAFGEQTKTPTEEAGDFEFVPDPVRDRPISAAEIARARAARDAEQAERTGKQTPPARKANGGRKRG